MIIASVSAETQEPLTRRAISRGDQSPPLEHSPSPAGRTGVDSVVSVLLERKRQEKTDLKFSLRTFFFKRKYAPLAQLVEQLTLNQWVPGSSP